VKRLVPVILGGLLLVGAVAGFVIEPEHHGWLKCPPGMISPTECHWVVGWSRTVHNAVRIGSWALLIAGVLLVTVGLISYARREAPRTMHTA
jgi:hypothetical protein